MSSPGEQKNLSTFLAELSEEKRASLLSLHFTHSRSQYQDQLERSRGMDARAATLLSISAALTGVAAVLLKDFSGPSEPLGLTELVLAAAIGGVFFLAVLASILAMRPKDWNAGPRAAGFLEGFQEYPTTEPAQWTARQISLAVEHNEAIIKAKARFINFGAWLVVALGLLVLALGVAVNLPG